jgi:hypothetical protein
VVDQAAFYFLLEPLLDFYVKYNMFGFLSNIVSATVKTALTPVAVIKDVVNVAVGEEADATKNLLTSVGEDLKEAGHNLANGE